MVRIQLTNKSPYCVSPSLTELQGNGVFCPIFAQLGCYEAEVQSSDYDDDEVDLVFLEEPGHVYKIPVFPTLVLGKRRLKKN